MPVYICIDDPVESIGSLALFQYELKELGYYAKEIEPLMPRWISEWIIEKKNILKEVSKIAFLVNPSKKQKEALPELSQG